LGSAVFALLIVAIFLAWLSQRRLKKKDWEVQKGLARAQASNAENRHQLEIQLEGLRQQIRDISRPELDHRTFSHAQQSGGVSGLQTIELQGSNTEGPQSPESPQSPGDTHRVPNF